MRGRREGIRQGSVYICLVMYSRVNMLRMIELPLRLHVLPKTLKAGGELCVRERDISTVERYLMPQTDVGPRLTAGRRERVFMCVLAGGVGGWRSEGRC